MLIVLSTVFYLLTLLYPQTGEGQKTIDKARDLLNRGKPVESISLLSSYKPSVEELSEYHYILARAFERSKRLQDYIDHLRLSYIYSTEDRKPSLLLERAEAYMKIGYYSEAILIYKVYLKKWQNSSETNRLYSGLGESLYKVGLYNEAVNYFSKAGDTVNSLYGTAISLQAGGKIKEANDAFTKAIEMNKDFLKSSEEAIYRFGENLMMMKRYKEARQYLTMIRNGILRAKAQLILGIISKDEKRYNEALQYLNSAFSFGDRDIKRQALYEIALIYIDRAEKKKAEGKLEDIRYNYPYGKVYDDAILTLARLYRESGNHDKAINILKELVFRRTPDGRAIDEFESIILSIANKDKEGTLRLWSAVGNWLLDPARSETLLKIAYSLRDSGTPFIKIASWIMKHGTTDAKEKASLLLAEFYADLGEYQSAMEYIKYIKLSKGKTVKSSDSFHRIMAKISFLSLNLKDAVNSLLSIREFNTEDLSLLSSVIGLSDRGSRDFKRLLEQYKKVVKNGGIRDYVRLADLLYDSGHKEDALKYYKQAIEWKGKGSQQSDERNWACYRINRITQEEKLIPMIEGGILKRLGDILIKQTEIDKTVKEVL